MKVSLTIICLFGLALGNDDWQGLSDDGTDMVNNIMNVLDSGLKIDSGVDEKGRALFISLTLTSTSTNLATATVTSTSTARCIEGTFTECTTESATTESATMDSATVTVTATAASGKRRSINLIVDHIIQKSGETDDHFSEVSHEFEGDFTVVKVFNGQREKVSISDIMPSKVQRKTLEVDFVMNTDETELQSGSMSWSEASVGKAHSACGRSGLGGDNKRARILALANEVVTKDLTSTHTVIETAADTTTFSVTLSQCTTAGFTFAVPYCTAR